MPQDNAAGGLRGSRSSLSQDLIETICDAYGFDSMKPVTDLGGSSCLNLLTDVMGSRHVLRVYRPYVSKERLNDIQHMRRQLIAGGVPCSNTLLTHHGEPWIEVDDRLVEVERYVDHDFYMDSWERLETALPMLGKIHTIMRDVPVGQEGKHPAFANYIDPQVIMERTLCGTRRIRTWSSSPFARHLADLSDELAVHVTTLGCERLSTHPKQLVHGDFWHSNVLFHHGDIVLVMDFDFMGERTRIDDLALTLYFTSMQYPESPVSDAQRIRLGRLVDAYDSGLSDHLSKEERSVLPIVLASQPMWSIGGWVANLDDEAASREHAEGTLWAVEWALEIIRHLDQWKTAFA